MSFTSGKPSAISTTTPYLLRTNGSPGYREFRKGDTEWLDKLSAVGFPLDCYQSPLTGSGLEKSMLISLYLGESKFVLNVKTVPSLVIY